MIMSTKKINWDAIGIATSIACAIHCALLPLVLTSLPLFGVNIINNLLFELCMILLAFCIGGYSLYHGWKKHHHSFLPLIIFCGGMLLLFGKQMWHSYELFLLIPAVLCIVSAHYLNFRLCRFHNHAYQDDGDY
jgi:MerC mercury resistance protein